MDDYGRKRRYRDRKLIRQGFDERLCRRIHRQAATDAGSKQPTLAQIASAENLLQVNNHRKAHGGTAYGPDRIDDSMLSYREECTIYRAVAAEIRAGRYEPSQARVVRLPKKSGGFRELSIRSIIHRTVSSALAIELNPFWDRMFLAGSHGFRPGRGPWSLLLDLERIVAEQERYVIAQDDIKQAFDNVPIQAVMDLHHRYLTDPELLVFISKILRGNAHERRVIGIDQGSAYSPITLNVLLHHVLDLPFSESATNPPWLRYADNLLYVTRSVTEGLTAISKAHHLLQPNLTLKGADGQPIDLRLGQANILGYFVKWENGHLRYDLGRDAWIQLQEKLSEVYRYPNPHQAALWALRGWIGYWGPTFEGNKDDTVINQILESAAQTGFSEISGNQVGRLIQSARDRWIEYRKRWLSRGVSALEKEETTAAPLATDATGHLAMSEAEVAVALSGGDLGYPF